jgi:hypothetical protein
MSELIDTYLIWRHAKGKEKKLAEQKLWKAVFESEIQRKIKENGFKDSPRSRFVAIQDLIMDLAQRKFERMKNDKKADANLVL